MARKPQIKRGDNQTLASPTQDNNLLAYAALFKVAPSGVIDSTSSFSPFLLNPDSLQDDKSGNWIENNIPGQSDPIIQWVSGGARTINFTALVTKDTAHFPEKKTDLASGLIDSAVNAVGAIASAFAGVNIPPIGDTIAALTGGGNSQVGEELSVAPYLDYYRSLMYPTIDENEVLSSSPPLLVLVMGKTLSSLTTKNVVGDITPNTDLWVAKNVGIRVTKWLPNLTPMEAEVTFQFTQYTMKSRTSPIPQSSIAADGGATGFSDIGDFF